MLFFKENFTNGEKTIYIEIISYTKGLVMALINEKNSNSNENFLKFKTDDVSNYYFQFSKLSKGSEVKSFPIPTTMGFFTFFNIHDKDNIVEFKISRIRSDTIGAISFILYTFITITIVFLFIVIICLACCNSMRKSSQERERQANRIIERRRRIEEARNEAREDYDDEDGEEEEELGPTLEETDLEYWMPIVDLKKEDQKRHNFKEENCSICIDRIDNKESVRKTKFCSHFFHDQCLRDWLEVNESCPNCKEDFSKYNLMQLEKKWLEKQAKLKSSDQGKNDLNKKTHIKGGRGNQVAPVIQSPNIDRVRVRRGSNVNNQENEVNQNRNNEIIGLNLNEEPVDQPIFQNNQNNQRNQNNRSSGLNLNQEPRNSSNSQTNRSSDRLLRGRDATRINQPQNPINEEGQALNNQNVSGNRNLLNRNGNRR